MKVDSCAFKLGKLRDTLTLENSAICDIQNLLQSSADSAMERNDTATLHWLSGLQGLIDERKQLVDRADSLMHWCQSYFNAVSKWQQAIQREANYDSKLVKMDDTYTSNELSAQKRNCEQLQTEIMRWRIDRSAFNRLCDTLNARTLFILAPKLVIK